MTILIEDIHLYITLIIIIILIIIILLYIIKYYTNLNLLKEPLNNNIKIAICISGKIDNLQYCYNSWKKHFLDKYPNIDIFMNVNESECSQDDKLFIQNTIQPKDVVYEDPTITDKLFYNNFTKMFYRIYQCNQLKINYSNKNNIKYDYVIRMRPDLVFFQDLIIDNFNLDKLYIPTIYYDLIDIVNVFGLGITDQFFISNDNIANIVASFFTNIQKYKDSKCILAELVLVKYIKDNNIASVKFNYLFFLHQYMNIRNMYKFFAKIQYLPNIPSCLFNSL